MNEQEVFNTVVTHLFAQGRRASNPDDGCFYRTPEGLKCAVGVLIPDALYRPDLEGTTAYGISYMIRDGVLPSIPGIEDDTISLLADLQIVHDNPESWVSTEILIQALRAAAEAYGLNTDVLNGKELTK